MAKRAKYPGSIYSNSRDSKLTIKVPNPWQKKEYVVKHTGLPDTIENRRVADSLRKEIYESLLLKKFNVAKKEAKTLKEILEAFLASRNLSKRRISSYNQVIPSVLS